MRCPKCRTQNPKGSTECDGCGVIFADIHTGGKPKTVRTCPWNDHGNTCGEVGSLSDTTNGDGPWYCSRHYWMLKGYLPRSIAGEMHVTARERWYSDHSQTYAPASLASCASFRCVGIIKTEPGQDWGDIAA